MSIDLTLRCDNSLPTQTLRVTGWADSLSLAVQGPRGGAKAMVWLIGSENLLEFQAAVNEAVDNVLKRRGEGEETQEGYCETEKPAASLCGDPRAIGEGLSETEVR